MWSSSEAKSVHPWLSWKKKKKKKDVSITVKASLCEEAQKGGEVAKE